MNDLGGADDPEPGPQAESAEDAEPSPGTEVAVDVDEAAAGMRLDQFLVRALPGRSRSFLARAIEKSAVRVDGVVERASHKLRAGACVRFTVPEPPRAGPVAEEIPLVFLHVDEWIAVVDKPPGMVVHPAKGNWKGTLAGALKWHLGGAAGEGLSTAGGPTRPGIVHRLDRDTSGAIIVARSEEAHHVLARQFEQRTVEKTYLAITQGTPRFDRDEINLPIGIHPYQREKMAIRDGHSTSREAVTRFEVVERFRTAALVRVTPKTGRTHQIRVHLAAIGCPVLCDALYSGRSRIDQGFPGPPAGATVAEPLLARQALHAARLVVDHPRTGVRMAFEAPLPADMRRVLDALRAE
ncbi:pseudouridine synthase [Planctomycetia bacterium]|jgi:23S rRNA pseudouridine1911/1915/1917 synthase|nr:pseudouridine synthase [Planctomycetia bacterium]